MLKNNEENFDFDGLIILEIANNHQGSVSHAKKIIHSFAPVVEKAGVRAAIKFQFRNLDTFIHPDFKNSKEHKHIERFLSTRLSENDFKILAQEASESGFVTMATPFDEESVDCINRLDIEVIKVASCSATDWPLLEKISKAGKPIVCSLAGLTIEKIDNLVSFFNHRGVQFALMHCVSLYPTPKHKLNLDKIRILKERYPNITIGFSTHEDPNNFDAIKVAYAKGARLFERHVGVEASGIKLNAYSSTPEQIGKWLDAYDDVVTMVRPEGDFSKIVDDEEIESLESLMRGVYVKKAIKKGEKITRPNVFFAMPLLSKQLSSGKWREGLIADIDYFAMKSLPESLLPEGIMKKEIIYKSIHDVKGILNLARIPINYESSVEILHPKGIEYFRDCGVFVIDCISREYSKKIVVILAGQSYPLHYHKTKEKSFQILFGTLEVAIADRAKTLYAGDTLLIPPGVWFQYAAGKGGAIIEEISSSADFHDMVFSDKDIETVDMQSRKTKLINWGRHQFDDIKDDYV